MKTDNKKPQIRCYVRRELEKRVHEFHEQTSEDRYFGKTVEELLDIALDLVTSESGAVPARAVELRKKLGLPPPENILGTMKDTQGKITETMGNIEELLRQVLKKK